MAKIRSGDFYRYPDGELLDVAGHGSNVFSGTEGRGLFSEVNGNLDIENLDGSVSHVGAQHIQPGETHRFAAGSGRETLDFWDAAFGQPNRDGLSGQSGAAVPEESYVPIPGCSVRIYLPYDCEMVLWQWSFFTTNARSFGTNISVNDDGDETVNKAAHPQVIHRAYLDDAAIYHTKRYFPQSWHWKKSATTKMSNTFQTEGGDAGHWDMHHLSTNVSKGWHELSARLYMEFNDGPAVSLKAVDARQGRTKDSAQVSVAHTHTLNNRLTFGIRNARAMAMMKTSGS
jgi:hypothetical protein